jgi:aryl-alcohol dehydrogenase-like predicted oxidoreductase
MKTRKLGKTGFEVSVLALGAWQLADDKYWGRGGDPERTVKVALDAGVTLFDTAEMYADGESEKALGKALGRDRDRALIASKVFSSHCAPAALRKACEDSLRRLHTDRIDLFQVHWPSRDDKFSDSAAELIRLRKEGKIRAMGVSNFGPKDLDEWMEVGEAVSDQIGYNLLFRAPEYEILPACAKHGVGVLTYMPLLQGILTGRWTVVEEIPISRRRTRHFASTREGTRHGEPGCEDLLLETLKRIKTVSTRIGHPPADVALAWLLAKPEVTSVIVGAREPDQVLRNVRGVGLDLDPDTVAELDDITKPIKDKLGGNADLWLGAKESRIR